MSEDAADEVVRIALNGTEVMLRLAGSGAKNLASLLISWSRSEPKTSGKTSLGRLLASGDTLHLVTLDRETYRQFRSAAKNKLLYSAFSDNRNDRKEIDVVFGQRNAALVDYLLSRIGYRAPERAEDVPPADKKKETPSWDPSAPQRWGLRANAETAGIREEKESVIEAMQQNQAILRERHAKKETVPGRTGDRER